MPLPATVDASLSWPSWRNARIYAGEMPNGAQYMVGLDRTNGHTEVWKSSDGGNTWAEQDGANRRDMGGTGLLPSTAATASCCIDGTKIVILQHTPNGTTFALLFFETATDTWLASSAGSGQIPSTDGTGNVPFSVVCRGAGDYVCAFQSATEAIMGTSYRRVVVRPYTAGAWGTSQNVEAGVQLHQDLGGAVIGSSGRVHVVWRSMVSQPTLRQRTFLSNNTFGTIGDIQASGTSSSPDNTAADYIAGAPFSYTDGADVKVVAPFRTARSGTNALRVGRFISADAPAYSQQDVSTANPPETLNSNVGWIAADGTTVHAFWADDATQDLWRDNDAGTGTWGTDTEHRDAITVGGVNVEKITGAFGILYDDAGAVRFDTHSMGPQTIFRTLSVAQVGTVGIIRDVTALRASVAASQAAVIKQSANKPLPAAQSSIASFASARAYIMSLAQTAPSVASVQRQARETKASVQATLGTLSRLATRALTGSQGSLGSHTKRASRSTAATSSITPTMATARAYLRSLAATAPVVGSLVRRVNASRTAVASSAATTTRSAFRALSAAAPVVGSLVRRVNASRAAAESSSASITRAPALRTTAAVPVVGSLVRRVNASRTAVASSAAAITRALSALRTLSAATSQVASARRATSRSTTAPEPEAAVVSRYPQQITRADLPQSASLRRSISRRFAAVASSVATLFAGGFVPDLLFPLKVRVQEYVAKVQAIEPGDLLVKVREAVASVRVSEPEVKARGYEPEARVQADESGSMIVEVNEEGSDK